MQNKSSCKDTSKIHKLGRFVSFAQIIMLCQINKLCLETYNEYKISTNFGNQRLVQK